MDTTFRPRHRKIDEEKAFVADPARGGTIRDDEVESFAEEFIASITGAESVVEDARNEETVDEIGGPFLEFMVTEEVTLETDAE